MKPEPRSLVFDRNFFEDLAYWVATDRKTALRILELVEAIRRDPGTGIGKPEGHGQINSTFGSDVLTIRYALQHHSGN